MRKICLFAISVLALVLITYAQNPNVSNTQFRNESATAGLGSTVDRFLQSSDTLWLGYEIPTLPQTRLCTCSRQRYDSSMEYACCGEIRLEQDENNLNMGGIRGTEDLRFYVLLRLQNGTITRVRSVSPRCELNAGGVPFHWLNDVSVDESAKYLAQLAENGRKTSPGVADEAISALSMHSTNSATDLLASIANRHLREHLGEQAAFWLGSQRGHEGFLALKHLENESDSRSREKLTFDFSINSDPGVVDELIRLGKTDPEPGVRGQAIFWLAQKAGKKEVAAIKDATENDPETSVKKKAVFALSQLPREQSLTELEHVAETNRNAWVRREAIFWIGQNDDPRAVEYLEKLLKK